MRFQGFVLGRVKEDYALGGSEGRLPAVAARGGRSAQQGGGLVLLGGHVTVMVAETNHKFSYSKQTVTFQKE